MSQDPFSPHEDVSGLSSFSPNVSNTFPHRTASGPSQTQAGALSAIHSHSALPFQMKIPLLRVLEILEIFKRQMIVVH